jgi:hypothetical protein
MARGGRGGHSSVQHAHRFWFGHHLTFPLLRNGPLPLPRFAAERSLTGKSKRQDWRTIVLYFFKPTSFSSQWMS